jgi:three-Cys-motif partner protein
MNDGEAADGSELLQQIGPWTEVKHQIIREYAAAYSRILAAQRAPRLHHIYIDAFAGDGRFLSRSTGRPVAGSPEIALQVAPPFKEYHFIDIDDLKVARLERLARGRDDVTIHRGDCNLVLVEDLLPHVTWQQFRRALCILDPYGMHLNWSTIETAGRLRTTELFINLPIMDINRNALRKRPEKVDLADAARMTALWGDESWRSTFYARSPQLPLFGSHEESKSATNEDIAEAFRARLKTVAGFAYVPRPMAMRNSIGFIVYYLFFASHKPVAAHIVEDIFSKHRKTN